DPMIAAEIEGVALQWGGGLGKAGPIHSAHPELEIMQSETDCGNWWWKPGYNPDRAPNDFEYGAYTWRSFRNFLENGASSYMLWNIVLDEEGKSIDSQMPWPQNSAIVIDRQTKQVTYTPMFWATKHFSGLVDIGARWIKSSGDYWDHIAFMNP